MVCYEEREDRKRKKEGKRNQKIQKLRHESRLSAGYYYKIPSRPIQLLPGGVCGRRFGHLGGRERGREQQQRPRRQREPCQESGDRPSA